MKIWDKNIGKEITDNENLLGSLLGIMCHDVVGKCRPLMILENVIVKNRSILERLGFKNEGVLRKVEWLYDNYVSYVVYDILNIEWNITL